MAICRFSVYLSWETVYSYIRISTHHGVFKNPLSPGQGGNNINALMNMPGVNMISSNEISWKIFGRLSGELHIRGNMAPDAVLASILEAHGVKRIYTADRDFWKFPFLKPVNPVE